MSRFDYCHRMPRKQPLIIDADKWERRLKDATAIALLLFLFYVALNMTVSLILKGDLL